MSRRPIAFAILLWYFPACTTWHVEKEVSPQQLIATVHPYVVRVTRADNSHLVLQHPTIAAGDSVTGVHNGVPSTVALSDVTQVAIRKVSAGQTIALVIAIPVVVAGIRLAEWASSCASNC